MKFLLSSVSLLCAFQLSALQNDEKEFSEFYAYNGSCKKLVIHDEEQTGRCDDLLFAAMRSDGTFPIMFNHRSGVMAFYGKETSSRHGYRAFAINLVVLKTPDSETREPVTGECTVVGVQLQDRLISCSAVSGSQQTIFAGEFQSDNTSTETFYNLDGSQ
jgi:hypothetical protein